MCRCGEFCLTCIWSTLKNVHQHARALRRVVDLMLSHRPPFPLPVHDGKTAIWHLADVLEWLSQRGNYTLPAATRELAQVTRQRNLNGSLQRYGLRS